MASETEAVLPPRNMPSERPRAVRWVHALVVAVAAVEVIGGVNDLSVFSDLSSYGRSPGQVAIFVNVALRPLLAAAALALALVGRLRAAIIALAGLAVAGLLLDGIPSLVTDGFGDFLGSVPGLVNFGHAIVLPALCVVAVVLAWQNRRLALAGVLACLPTLAWMADIGTFIAAVLIYGF